MTEPNLEIIRALKQEKRLNIFVAIYLSVVLLFMVFLLAKVSMTNEIQQALVIVLGLITVATVDAFRKALENNASSFTKEFKQIIVQEGGSYVEGNVEGDRSINVSDGTYSGGDIFYGYEKKQTLAEAAAEIQELLQQLEKSNPTATEAEKIAYLNKEIDPSLKSRSTKALEELFKELKKSNPAATEAEKIEYVNAEIAAEVIRRIQMNPSFKSRLIKASKSGGLAALEDALDNPIGAVLVATIKGWLEEE